MVVYPGEKLNLHIFEPRYKQLIDECYREAKPFGIPTVLNAGVGEMGTLVEIKEIVEKYDSGKMDIRTEGIKVFRILEIVKSIPDKLFSGAIVNYPANIEGTHRDMVRKVLFGIRELHKLLKVNKDFSKPDDELTSYDLAHHAGLSIDEEYEMLGLFHELQRLEYLKRHLAKVLPVVAGMEGLRERIQLNGHFREMGGFDL